MQDYSMRVLGRTDKTDYYFSLGYANTEGTLIGNNLERYSGSFNLNSEVTKWLKIGVNYRLAYAKGVDQWSTNYWQMAQTPPWQPIYDANGPKGYAPVVAGIGDDGVYSSAKLYGVGTRINVPGQIAFNDTKYVSLRNMGNTYISIEPIEGLTIKGQLNVDTYTTTRYQFHDLNGNVMDYTLGDPRAVGGGNSVGTYDERETINNNLIGEVSATYDRSFGDHHINVLLDAMQQHYDSKSKGSSTEYMTTTLDYLRKLGGENQYTTAESDLGRWALAGNCSG